jgi:hypothetical protein
MRSRRPVTALRQPRYQCSVVEAPRMRARQRLLAIVAMLPIALSACMSSPRDGQWTQQGQTVRFSGHTGNANTALRLQTLNQRTGEWEDHESVTSSDSSLTDATGTSWYAWQFDSVMPTAFEKYLRPGISGEGRRSNAVDMRVWDPTISGPEKTFNQDADQCMRDHQSGGGYEIMNSCARSEDFVTIYVRCGQDHDNCCLAGEFCDSGLSCVHEPGSSESYFYCAPPVAAPPVVDPPTPPTVVDPPTPQVEFPGQWWTVSCVCTDDVGSGQWDVDYCFDVQETPAFDFPCSYVRDKLINDKNDNSKNGEDDDRDKNVNCHAAGAVHQGGDLCNAVPGAVTNFHPVQ